MGYPEGFCSVGTSVAATRTFQTGWMCDCGSIRLDQVSSAWQVVSLLADKGNSLVILPTQQYNTKIQAFIENNNFQKSTTNRTKTFQNQIRKTINHSTTRIPQGSKWKFINLNPSAPTIKGLIKLHKPDQSTRPIVNWCNTPAYNLSRLFTSKITQIAPLPQSFNIKNTTELINQLQQTPIVHTSTSPPLTALTCTPTSR